MSLILNKIYQWWNNIVTISTPLIGLYAIYDIKDMIFNEDRKKEYSRKYPKFRKFEPVNFESIKDNEKNIFVKTRPSCIDDRGIISLCTVICQTVYAVLGRNIEFGISDNDPLLNAKWTKNGHAIKSEHSERTKFKINNVTLDDEGLYVCMIESNKMHFQYELIVLDMKKIYCITNKEAVFVIEGDAIEFGLQVEKTKQKGIYVRWEKPDRGSESMNSESATTYKIDRASRDDEGVYVCNVTGNCLREIEYHLFVVGQRISKCVYTTDSKTKWNSPSRTFIEFVVPNITKITIRCEGREVHDVSATVGSKRLSFRCVIMPVVPYYQSDRFVYENDKFTEDNYKYEQTQIRYSTERHYVYITIVLTRISEIPAHKEDPA